MEDLEKDIPVIREAIKEELLKPDPKEIQLDFDNSKGDINSAIAILQEMHRSKVEFIATCKGNLDLASTILIAGCKIGSRKSELASFCLNEDTTKIGKTRKSLTANERNALDILGQLTRKRSKIEAKMTSGETLISSEAKTLGLVDESILFVDRYAEERKASKKDKGKDKKKEGENKDNESSSEKGKEDKEQKPDSKK